MPLEDCMGGGDCTEGSGTRASHWEARVMAGDLMVGALSSSDGRTTAISDLTLALFEDSGWYGLILSHVSP